MPNRLISITSIKFSNKEQEDQGTLATSAATSYQRNPSKSGHCDYILAFAALQIAGLGLFASISSTCFCNYFQVSVASKSEDNGYGIWMVATDETNKFLACAPYPSSVDTLFDIYFLTSRAMSILSPISCFAAIAFSYFANVGNPAKQQRRLLFSIFFMLVGAVMQGLTLMVLESSLCHNGGGNKCGRSYGANMSIASATLMGVALFFLIILTGRRDIEYDTGRGEDVHETKRNDIQIRTEDDTAENANKTEGMEGQDITYSTCKTNELGKLEEITIEDELDDNEKNIRNSPNEYNEADKGSRLQDPAMERRAHYAHVSQSTEKAEYSFKGIDKWGRLI
mmetsp:Transcript_31583/g.48085  ORF Transcript_31583/g.48085 Transcript_31583/m.48085 type:complete len:339 (-) Transcript_31583:105-1121(-)